MASDTQSRGASPRPIEADDAELVAGLPPVAQAQAGAPRAVFGRMARNLGWLLGGRGILAVASLIYLAAAARGLGPSGFGLFTLVLAYGQAIANLAQFQSWQGVIRFGAVHLAQAREDRLARLLGFTATLDFASASLGALLALAGTSAMGSLLGWTEIVQHRAGLFSAVLLLSTGATPNGMLKLHNRFDVLTAAESVGPVARLVGAVAAWWLEGGLDAFLAAWAGAAVLQSLVQWWAALRLPGARLAFGRAAWAGALAENDRLWNFMWQASLSASLGLVWQQLGTLAVGHSLGATAAGGYRLAARLAKAIARPVQSAARVLYPELARMAAGEDRATFTAVVRRVAAIGLGLGLLLVVVATLLGRPALRLLGGAGFEFARPYLVLFALASAIDLSGFALEPLHNAFGRSGRVLGTRLLAAALYIVALALLLPWWGGVGAVVASVVSSLALRVVLGRSAAQLLRAGRQESPDTRPDQKGSTAG